MSDDGSAAVEQAIATAANHGQQWAPGRGIMHVTGGYDDIAEVPLKGGLVLLVYQLAERAHRVDGPATLHSNGEQTWRLAGRLHRFDGPAEIGAYGDLHWYVCGRRHRLDGPAIMRANGNELWYRNGLLHCLTGPAHTFRGQTRARWAIHGEPANALEVARAAHFDAAGARYDDLLHWLDWDDDDQSEALIRAGKDLASVASAAAAGVTDFWPFLTGGVPWEWLVSSASGIV